MNTKILTSVGCLLLLAATIAPAVLGHDDNSDDPAGANANGVSGRYTGPAGPSTTDSALNNAAVQEGADTTNAFGNMLCDMEVAGPGSPGGAAVDEMTVDGWTGGAGTMADASTGTIGGVDDGGQGGACHVNSYDEANYNTPGCNDGDVAYANDDQAGGNVWISASCDWETQGGDGGVLVCIVNGVLHASTDEIVGCVLQFVSCLTFPAACAGGSSDVCGGDGTADGANYGFGGSGVAFPTNTPGAEFGEWYNPLADSDYNVAGTGDDICAQTDATEQVFVFSNVDTVNGVQPATTGDIWSA